MTVLLWILFWYLFGVGVLFHIVGFTVGLYAGKHWKRVKGIVLLLVKMNQGRKTIQKMKR